MSRKSYLASTWDSDDDLLDSISIKNEKDELDRDAEDALLGASDADEEASNQRFEFIVNDDEFAEDFEEDNNMESLDELDDQSNFNSLDYTNENVDSYNDIGDNFVNQDYSNIIEIAPIIQDDHVNFENGDTNVQSFIKNDFNQIDDDDEEDVDDDAGRPRFKAERPPDIRLQLSRKNTVIPEKLEISKEDEKKITEFMQPKTKSDFKKPQNYNRLNQLQQKRGSLQQKQRGILSNFKHATNFSNIVPMRNINPLLRNMVNYSMNLNRGLLQRPQNQIFGQYLGQNRLRAPKLQNIKQQNLKQQNQRFTEPMRIENVTRNQWPVSNSNNKVTSNVQMQAQLQNNQQSQNIHQSQRPPMAAQSWQKRMQQSTNFDNNIQNFSTPRIISQPMQFSNVNIQPNQNIINHQLIPQQQFMREPISQPIFRNNIIMQPVEQNTNIVPPFGQQQMVRVIQMQPPAQQPVQRMLLPDQHQQLNLHQQQQIPYQQNYLQNFHDQPQQQMPLTRYELNPRMQQMVIVSSGPSSEQNLELHSSQQDNFVGQPIETVVANRNVQPKKPANPFPQHNVQKIGAANTNVKIDANVAAKNAANKYEAEQQKKLLARARRFGQAALQPTATNVSLKRQSSDIMLSTEPIKQECLINKNLLETNDDTVGSRMVILNQPISDDSWNDFELKEKLEEQKRRRLEVLRRKELRRQMMAKTKLKQIQKNQPIVNSTFSLPSSGMNMVIQKTITNVNHILNQPTDQQSAPMSKSQMIQVRPSEPGISTILSSKSSGDAAGISNPKQSKVHKMVVTKEQYLEIVKQMKAKGLAVPNVVKKKMPHKIINQAASTQRRIVVNTNIQASKSVLIDGLTSFTTMDTIAKLAENIGPIQNIELKQQKAYIEFFDPKHAIQFAASYNRHMIDLAIVTVSIINNK